jgi:naphthoate synthase
MIFWKLIKSFNDIFLEHGKGISKITINRPHVRNAFRPKTVWELIEAMKYCSEDSETDVIILTGVGNKAFCCGGDQNYKWLGGYVDKQGVPSLNILDLQKKIRELSKPVIAMVNGYALGGGNVINVVCDLTISSENALFGQNGPKVGSFEGGLGSSYLARNIGQKRAREIWFLCNQYSAYEYFQMGLVNKVVPAQELEEATVKWCKIIQNKSPMALRIIKRCFNAELDGQHGLMQLAGDATLMFSRLGESH